MAYIRVCDLCGKPLQNVCEQYRIKKRWVSLFLDSGWETIDAHEECVKKLLNSLDDTCERDRVSEEEEK